MTLLLALFVVLFASSQIDEARMKEFAEKFGEAPQAEEETPVGQTNRRRLLDTFYALRGKLRKEVNRGQVAMSLQPRGVVVTLQESGFFAPGRADLAPEARPTLEKIAQSLADDPSLLRFEGHTDNIPIETRQFPSNWHLSTARAVSVMRYFDGVLERPAESMFVAGYGEQRPVKGNETAEGRAANRRVELVIMAGG